jgi:hypothetical protein
MIDYQSFILNALLDKYEQSKHYRTPGQSSRGVFLRYDRSSFPDYWIDSTADYRLEINRVTRQLTQSGLIEIRWAPLAENLVVDRVGLSLQAVDRAYAVANRVPLRARENRLREVASRWLEKWSPGGIRLLDQSDLDPGQWAALFASAVTRAVDDGSRLPVGLSPDDGNLLDEICRVIDAGLKLEQDIPKRVLSLRVLGHTKRLEQIESRFVRVLKEFYPGAGEIEDRADLMAELGIVETPQHIFLAGPLALRSEAGAEIDVAGFTPDVGLSGRFLLDCRIVGLKAERILTIENLSCFYHFLERRPSGALAVYLGGYHSRMQRAFLVKLRDFAQKESPGTTFHHWGDLDLGGFRIFRHLRDRCGLPLQPYLMDKATYLSHLHRGIEFDRAYGAKLQALLLDQEYAVFHDVISEMLVQGKKLEQESIEPDRSQGRS